MKVINVIHILRSFLNSELVNKNIDMSEMLPMNRFSKLETCSASYYVGITSIENNTVERGFIIAVGGQPKTSLMERNYHLKVPHFQLDPN